MQKRSIVRSIAAAVACFSARGREFELDVVRPPRTGRGVNVLPVAFPSGGVSSLERSHPLSIYGDISPWHWHTYFNDFDKFLAADWIVTETQAAATQGVIAGDGGVLSLVNSAADNDLNAIQSTPSSFRMTVGKPFVFGARWQVSDAVQSDVIIGMQIADATPLATTDGIWFEKTDDAALLNLHVAKASAQTDANGIATIVNNTYVTTEFAYDGEGKIFYGINGVIKGFVAATNLPDTQDIAVQLAVQNGDAVVRTLLVDYVFAAKFMGTTR